MTERISSYSRVAFHGDDLTLNLMNSRIEGDENKNEIQNNVQDNMSLDNAPLKLTTLYLHLPFLCEIFCVLA